MQTSRALWRVAAASGMVITLAAASIASVQAQAVWPSEGKPIRFVGPGSAGSTSDIIGRLVGDHVARSLGVPVILEQRPGGATLIAAEHVARSAPDGNTYMIASIAPLAIAPAMNPAARFDPMKDVVGVARLVTMPNVLVVNKDLPVRNVQELLAYAKSRASALDYGAVTGTSSHFSHVLLGKRSGTPFSHVPYKSNTESLMAVIKGEVAFTIDNATLLISQIKGGTVRALAVTSDKRLADLPDVPTMQEAGVPDFVVESWFGLVAPAGTPPAVVERMSMEVGKALANPDLAAQLRKLGAEPAPQSAAAFSSFYRAENARWVPLVRESSVKPN